MLNKILLILGVVGLSFGYKQFNRMEQIQVFSEVLKISYPSPMNVNVRLCWDQSELIKVSKVFGDSIRSITFEKMDASVEQFHFNTILVLDLNCPDIESLLNSNIMMLNKNVKWFFLNSDHNNEKENHLIETVDRLNLEGGSEVFFITQSRNGSDLFIHQGKRAIQAS